MIKSLNFSEIFTSKVKLNLKGIFLCEKPQFDPGLTFDQRVDQKVNSKSQLFDFSGFLHEMNRKSLTDARPTDGIKK